MIDLLRNVTLFHNLSDTQLSTISSLCKTKIYKAGTILFHEQEMGTIFYIIVSGSVKIYTTQVLAGEEKILAVLAAGESFGELSLLDGKPRSATAQAIQDTQVLSISGSDFIRLLQSQFDINIIIVKELCNRLRETNQHVYDLTFLDAKERVINNLVRLAKKHGDRKDNILTINLNLNVDELSKMAGVPQALLAQMFKEWKLKQIISFEENKFSLNLSNIHK